MASADDKKKKTRQLDTNPNHSPDALALSPLILKFIEDVLEQIIIVE
jgi:hypothetical protein